MSEQKLLINIQKRPLLWFLMIPLLVELLLIGLYFSGSEALQAWIVPQWSVNNYINREFGLLENIQNLILLVALITACYYLRHPANRWRGLNIMAIAGFLFLFLEEIDYGWHVRERLFGLPPGTEDGYFRNLHNQNDGFVRILIQVIADATLGMLFLLPVIKSRLPVLSKIRLIPGQWFSVSALGLAATTGLAYLLKWENPGMPDPLVNNTGEFTELWFYYLALLYLIFLRDEFILKENNPKTNR